MHRAHSFGVLSEDFYNALMAGELEQYDAYDETRADFSRWKGEKKGQSKNHL